MLGGHLKWVLALIIALHVLLLAKTTFFPYSELFVYPYLANNGLLPYRDILDQHFPGLLFLPLNFNTLGMTTPRVALAWLLGSVVLNHWLMYFVATKLLKLGKKAVLVNLLYFIFQPVFEGNVLWLDSFLPSLLLLTYIFMASYIDSNKFKYLELSGLMLGLAVVFKQVTIPLVIILACYLLVVRRNSKEVLLYLLAFFLPVLLMLVYLSAIGVLVDFWYWTVVYNLTIFAESGRKAILSFSDLVKPLFVFMPAFWLWILHFKNKKVFLLGLFMIGSLGAIYARFDFIHLQPSLPFAVLLLGSCFTAKRQPKLFAHLLCVGYLLVGCALVVRFYKSNLGDNVVFFDRDVVNITTKVRELTSPGQKIFVYGAIPHIYQTTQTVPAGDVFVFQFPWFMTVAEERVFDGLVMDTPAIIVSDLTVSVSGKKLTDYTPRIKNYIDRYYDLVYTSGNLNILTRR